MSDAARDRLLGQIRKLIERARGTDSVHERDTALATARGYAVKAGITWEQAEALAEPTARVGVATTRDAWRDALASRVARAHEVGGSWAGREGAAASVVFDGRASAAESAARRFRELELDLVGAGVAFGRKTRERWSRRLELVELAGAAALEMFWVCVAETLLAGLAPTPATAARGAAEASVADAWRDDADDEPAPPRRPPPPAPPRPRCPKHGAVLVQNCDLCVVAARSAAPPPPPPLEDDEDDAPPEPAPAPAPTGGDEMRCSRQFAEEAGAEAAEKLLHEAEVAARGAAGRLDFKGRAARRALAAPAGHEPASLVSAWRVVLVGERVEPGYEVERDGRWVAVTTAAFKGGTLGMVMREGMSPHRRVVPLTVAEWDELSARDARAVVSGLADRVGFARWRELLERAVPRRVDAELVRGAHRRWAATWTTRHRGRALRGGAEGPQ